MKRKLLYLMVCCSISSMLLSQEFNHRFYGHPNSFYIKADSTLKMNYDCNYSVSHPRLNKTYLQQNCYSSKNGDSIMLHIFPNNLVYYEAFDSSKTLVVYGELTFDAEDFKIDTVPHEVDDSGDIISYINDTTFALVPHGKMFFLVEDNFVIETEYKLGEKHGESWKYLEGVRFYWATFWKEIYENDSLIEREVFYSFNKNEVIELLSDKWFLYLTYSNSFNTIVAVKEHKGYVFLIMKIEFSDENNCSYKEIRSCCGGRKCPDYKEAEWSVTDDAELIIDGMVFEILYFNKDCLYLGFP